MEAAAEVADYAKPLGVKCIYEDQGLFANGVDGFGAFYRQMKALETPGPHYLYWIEKTLRVYMD